MMSDSTTNDSIYEEIFDSISDGIIVVDKSFTIREINYSSERLLNTSRTQLIGKQTFNIFDEKVNDLLHKSYKEERTISDDDMDIGLINGKQTNLQLTVSPNYSKKGELIGLILQLKDIYGLKFLSGISKQQLISENFEQLIMGLAHELKNPISGIKGAAQILSNNISKEEKIKCSEIIVNEADRLNNLIDRFKKLESFTDEEFDLLDLHEILLDIIFLESVSSSNKIKIIQDFDVTIPPIKGDENSLKQVFINLINNSIESISGKGSVTISTKWVNDYKFKAKYAINICIKDTGKGIPKEKLDKIFTPFYTTKKSGSGLGLFISYQIISKHGGAIFVESEEKQGSEFNVYLPA